VICFATRLGLASSKFILKDNFYNVVSKKKLRVCISMLGVKKDTGARSSWRPTVALCGDLRLAIGRLELLHQRRYTKLARSVVDEIKQISPRIEVRLRQISLGDPWDFQQVYSSLYSFAKEYLFDVEKEEYLLHITTGTLVAQICMFMLTDSHHFPGRLVQSLPPSASPGSSAESFTIIDLELSKYDQLAALVRQERRENAQLLKDGIKTKNAAFNRMIAQVEQVASASRYPVVEPNQSAIRGLLLSREATGNDPKDSTLELAHYPKSSPAMALTDD
jgi:transcriptional regulatory protein RtcR